MTTKTSTPDPLERIARAAPVVAKLRAIRGGAEPVVFEHVTESAHPFLVALIAREITARSASPNPQSAIRNPQSLWVVCENVRAQELLHNELLNWFPDALFMPETEAASAAGALPDPETTAERLEILQGLAAAGERQIVVLIRAALTEQVPSPAGLKQVSVKLPRGSRTDRDKLLGQLAAAGYESAPQVSLRGQFAVRGGILDIFSWHHSQPVRIEFFDDVIESIRQFDLDAQTSVQHLDTCTLLLGESDEKTCALADYIRQNDLVIESDCERERVVVSNGEAARLLERRSDEPLEETESSEAPRGPSTSLRSAHDDEGGESFEGGGGEDFSTAFFEHGLGEFEAGDFVVEESKRMRFFKQLREWREDGWSTFIFCNNEGEIERLRDLIPEEELANVALVIGLVSRGFTFPAAKVAVLSDAELFGRYRNTRARRLSLRRAREQANRAQIDFSELEEGQLVVHLEHGIGKFLGLQSVAQTSGLQSEQSQAGSPRHNEVLVLEFADDAKLYVPLEQSFLVSRYIGVGKKSPPLSSLGDGRWSKAKKSAEQAVFDYAGKLLALHAERETSRGFAFPPDTKWQGEFERSFFFKETPDQNTAIAATKADMESERPMDRLVCGDVGFGKTEVAIRGAFKAVMSGKQVAVLVPTTVLAQQHYQTFRERMSDYPVVVEMLSRFRSPAEQRKTIAGLRDGGVDIVIGTHRLISKDVQFKELGLVVIDEEQRFGVLHKEKFKALFQLVDVLTLSATPIPRTLYLSLMGAKDMSIIETPPANRIPTETIICGYDERVIRDAIRREMERQGQVYFLHNRVQSIERIAQRIKMLVPDVRVEIGHGQMDEHELEEVMQRFVDGKSDVLVSTTIIESGLDIPNANTIIIDRADRFGLADLYQLRGRVGRAQHKAYAYLMLPRDMMSVGAALKRINAIKQYSSLGAGFKIAMRDLEIRGAGNILGTQQSGHILAIGFDLYCQLLKQAIAKLKGEKVKPRIEVVLRLDFVATNEADFSMTNDETRMTKEVRSTNAEIRHSSFVIRHCPAFLPVAYITEPQTRIKAYRQLAEVATQEQLDRVRKDWRDRFGLLPDAVENLLVMTEIKLVAAARKIARVEVSEGKLMLTRGGDYILIGGKFPRLTATNSGARLREILTLINQL